MISVLVFVLGVVILLYFLLFSSGKHVIEQLKIESETIPLRISSSKTATDNLAFVIDGKVDKNKLNDIAGMNYPQLKSQLGVRNEFCIYIEDKDGNIVNISGDIEKEYVTGVGNPEFRISDEYNCG